MRKILIALSLALAGSLAMVGHELAQASPVAVGQVLQAPVTIALSGTTSAAIAAKGMSLVGVQLPATVTSTAMTFTVSSDGVTYVPLYNSAGAVSYTIAGGRFIAINPVDFYGATYFKIVMGSSEAASRSLTAILKGI
jgi:hypothetical protein